MASPLLVSLRATPPPGHRWDRFRTHGSDNSTSSELLYSAPNDPRSRALSPRPFSTFSPRTRTGTDTDTFTGTGTGTTIEMDSTARPVNTYLDVTSGDEADATHSSLSYYQSSCGPPIVLRAVDRLSIQTAAGMARAMRELSPLSVMRRVMSRKKAPSTTSFFSLPNIPSELSFRSTGGTPTEFRTPGSPSEAHSTFSTADKCTTEASTDFETCRVYRTLELPSIIVDKKMTTVKEVPEEVEVGGGVIGWWVRG